MATKCVTVYSHAAVTPALADRSQACFLDSLVTCSGSAQLASRRSNNGLRAHPYAMLLPHSDYNPHPLCLISNPFLDKINLGRYRRTFGLYFAASPFSLSSFLTVPRFSLRIRKFFDVAILSAHAHPPPSELDYPVLVRVTSADWVPACALSSASSSST